MMRVLFGNSWVKGKVLGKDDGYPPRNEYGFWWRSDDTDREHFISTMWDDTYTDKP